MATRALSPNDSLVAERFRALSQEKQRTIIRYFQTAQDLEAINVIMDRRRIARARKLEQSQQITADTAPILDTPQVQGALRGVREGNGQQLAASPEGQDSLRLVETLADSGLVDADYGDDAKALLAGEKPQVTVFGVSPQGIWPAKVTEGEDVLSAIQNPKNRKLVVDRGNWEAYIAPQNQTLYVTSEVFRDLSDTFEAVGLGGIDPEQRANLEKAGSPFITNRFPDTIDPRASTIFAGLFLQEIAGSPKELLAKYAVSPEQFSKDLTDFLFENEEDMVSASSIVFNNERSEAFEFEDDPEKSRDKLFDQGPFGRAFLAALGPEVLEAAQSEVILKTVGKLFDEAASGFGDKTGFNIDPAAAQSTAVAPGKDIPTQEELLGKEVSITDGKNVFRVFESELAKPIEEGLLGGSDDVPRFFRMGMNLSATNTLFRAVFGRDMFDPLTESELADVGFIETAFAQAVSFLAPIDALAFAGGGIASQLVLKKVLQKTLQGMADKLVRSGTQTAFKVGVRALSGAAGGTGALSSFEIVTEGAKQIEEGDLNVGKLAEAAERGAILGASLGVTGGLGAGFLGKLATKPAEVAVGAFVGAKLEGRDPTAEDFRDFGALVVAIATLHGLRPIRVRRATELQIKTRDDVMRQEIADGTKERVDNGENPTEAVVNSYIDWAERNGLEISAELKLELQSDFDATIVQRAAQLSGTVQGAQKDGTILDPLKTPLAKFTKMKDALFSDAPFVDLAEARKNYHRVTVEDAVNSGKEVAPEVLKDYPGLEAKVAEKAAKAEAKPKPLTEDVERFEGLGKDIDEIDLQLKEELTPVEKRSLRDERLGRVKEREGLLKAAKKAAKVEPEPEPAEPSELRKRFDEILTEKLKGTGFENDPQSPVYRAKSQEALEQLKTETGRDDINFGTLVATKKPEVTVEPVESRTVESLARSEDSPLVEGGTNLKPFKGQNKSTGLSPVIKQPTEGFLSNIIEAARQLGSTVRWKKLKGGTLGQIRKVQDKDVIEVGNMKDIASVAHELGHKMDFTMFAKDGAFAPRLNLGQRFGGQDKLLRTEAKSVSYVYRPLDPLNVSSSHLKYRNSSKELMADFIATYMVDPSKARELAPTLTGEFEKALRNTPDVKLLVDQIAEGHVKPTPGRHKSGVIQLKTPTPDGDIVQRATPSTSQQIRTMTTSLILWGQSKIKGTKDPVIRAVVENLVKSADRFVQTVTKTLPVQAKLEIGRELKPSEWEDVGAFVEGIGNLKIHGDTKHTVAERIAADPALEKAVTWYRRQNETMRSIVNAEISKISGDSEYIGFIDDYLAHFYVSDRFVNTRKNYVKGVGSLKSLLKKNSGNRLPRRLWTLEEASQSGLVPVTQNAMNLLQMWSDINFRVSETKKIISTLKTLVSEEGLPVLMNEKTLEADLAGYQRITDPAFKRKVAQLTDAGNKVILERDVYIHPEALRAIEQIIGLPTTNNRIMAYWDTFNAYAKKLALSVSLFHHIALTESAFASIKAKGGNIARPILMLWEADPTTGKVRRVTTPSAQGVRLMGAKVPEKEVGTFGPDLYMTDMLQSGLTVGSPVIDVSVTRISRDLGNLEAKLRGRGLPLLDADNPLSRFATEIVSRAKRFNDGWDTILWDRYHSGLKAFTYYDVVQREVKKNPDMTPEALRQYKETVASYLNDAFGGQEWVANFWASPKNVRRMHRLLLAPDWTISNLKIFGQTAVTTDPKRRKLQIDYWRRMITTVAVSSAGMQAAIYQAFGDPKQGDQPDMFENELGHEFDPDITPLMRALPGDVQDFLEFDERTKGRMYLRPFKQIREIPQYFFNWAEALAVKGAPTIQIAQDIVGATGLFDKPDIRDIPFNKYMTQYDDGLWESIVGQFFPFSFRGNNFLFTVPIRRGMTFFKAQTFYRHALGLYADPSLADVLIPGGDAGRLFQQFISQSEFLEDPAVLVRDITEAAYANGIDAKRAYDNALQEVKAKFLGDYLKALKEGDHDKLDKSAEILVKLWADEDALHNKIGTFLFANPRVFPEKNLDRKELLEVLERKIGKKRRAESRINK